MNNVIFVDTIAIKCMAWMSNTLSLAQPHQPFEKGTLHACTVDYSLDPNIQNLFSITSEL